MLKPDTCWKCHEALPSQATLAVVCGDALADLALGSEGDPSAARLQKIIGVAIGALRQASARFGHTCQKCYRMNAQDKE